MISYVCTVSVYCLMCTTFISSDLHNSPQWRTLNVGRLVYSLINVFHKNKIALILFEYFDYEHLLSATPKINKNIQLFADLQLMTTSCLTNRNYINISWN